MEKLNFPDFAFRTRGTEPGIQIFDIIRKKFVALSPEEWVRQHVLHLFVGTLKYPPALISVEKSIQISGKRLRYDLIVFNRDHQPAMIVECKAPQVPMTLATMEQVSRYNIFSRAGWVYMTNGLTHYLYKVDFVAGKSETVSGFPTFDQL